MKGSKDKKKEKTLSERDESIKSELQKYVKALSTILSVTKKIEVDPLSKVSYFNQAIDSIGLIISSDFVVKKEIEFNTSKTFNLKHLGAIQYTTSILQNIFDLPILYSKCTRIAAIRQIGKIFRRIGSLKNQKYVRCLLSTSRFLQTRLFASLELPTDITCAYLFAIGRMAVDSVLQDILIKTVETFITNFNKYSIDIQIAVCKAAQYIEQPTEKVIRLMNDLANNRKTDSVLSSVGAATYLKLEIQMKNSSKVNIVVDKISSILESENDYEVKSSLKMIYFIVSNNNSKKEKLFPVLMDFINSDAKYQRDYALYILTKLEVEVKDDEYIQELATICIHHFNYSNNNNKVPLKHIIKAASLIASHYKNYTAQISKITEDYIKNHVSVSKSLFLIKTMFSESEISKFEADEIEETCETDPFEGYEQSLPKLSPHISTVLDWRDRLTSSPQLKPLYTFEFKVPQIGYNKTSEWFSPPTGFQIYEDVVACFTMCCVTPTKSDLTIPAFIRHLSDKQRAKERVPVTWEQVSNILGQYSVLNYVQLFYALCMTPPDKFDAALLKEILTELHHVLETLLKMKQDKNVKRTPQVEPPKRSH
ncbi:hypothetical protein TRFO_27340 [Tritrichomonas foetus]|uniref:Uncharacterized protein n=1 Tax=Tritrichomonas foetus TaxID=1144522 RepID=A0A1J4K238_9EUKA|nr:hypothetical protein TRFO_27340 [Tritrichomonas foetus]|eukprot:OHT05026.1 hypothetical protein TRFO_27340 [Tritrichomonas foetus]